MHRCQDAKRHGLLRFELFRKIKKILDLIKRNILISPLEGEIKFLSELRGLRNFREGGNLKYSCRNSNSDLPKQLRCIPLNKFLMLERKLSLFIDTVFLRFTFHFLHKRTAFTLAEVLITLGIIGIVAALTLPVIISDVKNSQLEAGLKKAYSVLGQALNMYQAENGERIIAGDATNRRMIKSYLMQYIKSAKGINDNYCSNTSTHNMNGAVCTNSALMNKNFFKKLPR